MSIHFQKIDLEKNYTIDKLNYLKKKMKYQTLFTM
jgi:hypothetical protein